MPVSHARFLEPGDLGRIDLLSSERRTSWFVRYTRTYARDGEAATALAALVTICP